MTRLTAKKRREERGECDDRSSCGPCKVWLMELQLSAQMTCKHHDMDDHPDDHTKWREYPWSAEPRCKYWSDEDGSLCGTFECPLCGSHFRGSAWGQAYHCPPVESAIVGGCKDLTVEAYLDAGEACMCGEEPWVQLPGGVWYNEADLQECNLNGDRTTDKGGQSSRH